MPKKKLSLLLAGIILVAALLSYFCGFQGRKPYVYLRRSKNVPRNERLQRWGQPKEDKKVIIEIDEEPGNMYSGVVKKTAFSSKMRMVFPVGLEGTGHHFVNLVLKSVCKLETVVCPNVCDMVLAMYDHMGKAKTTTKYKTGLALLQHEMKALVVTADGLGNGTAHFATFAGCHEGMMSYPMLSGPDKPLQYVDLKILAREAERAGIDLRLLYLGRPAKDILISDTVHRDFGDGFAHEARVLINNAAVVGSTLHEVDPEFVTCISYADITTDPAQAARIADAVVPAPGVADKISHSILKLAEHKTPTTEDPVVIDDQQGWDLMTNRLQEKLDEIERDQCRGGTNLDRP